MYLKDEDEVAYNRRRAPIVVEWGNDSQSDLATGSRNCFWCVFETAHIGFCFIQIHSNFHRNNLVTSPAGFQPFVWLGFRHRVETPVHWNLAEGDVSSLKGPLWSLENGNSYKNLRQTPMTQEYSPNKQTPNMFHETTSCFASESIQKLWRHSVKQTVLKVLWNILLYRDKL